MKRFSLRSVATMFGSAALTVSSTAALGQALSRDFNSADYGSVMREVDRQVDWYNNRIAGAHELTPQTAIYPQLGTSTPGASIVAAYRVRGLTDVSNDVPAAPLTQEKVNAMRLRSEGSLFEFYADGTFARVPVAQRVSLQDGDEFPVTRGRYQVQGNQVFLRASSSTNNAGGLVERGMEGVLTFDDSTGTASATVRESLFYGFDDQVVNDRARTYTLALAVEGAGGGGAAGNGAASGGAGSNVQPIARAPGNAASTLVGVWYADGTLNGQPCEAYYAFGADGALHVLIHSQGQPERSVQGVYSFSNGALTIRLQDGSTKHGSARVAGQQMELTVDGGRAVYQRVR